MRSWQRPLRLEPGMSVAALLEELDQSSFGARSVALAAKLAASWHRQSLRVIMSISGALSVAQQTSIVAQLVESRLVHAVITTGAVVTHSVTSEAGGRRRAVQPGESDDELAQKGLNRIFDTIESDSNFDILKVIADELDADLFGAVGSASIVRQLGLSPRLSQGGLITTAARMGAPVFVPALSDSELGLRLAGVPAAGWHYDAFADLAAYRNWIESGSDCALLSLGGGAPRNWAQQMFAEIDAPVGKRPQLVSGVRVCPDAAALGHLSGSTFLEARSWRKIPRYSDEAFVEVSADFTIVFPLIAEAMLRSTSPIVQASE